MHYYLSLDFSSILYHFNGIEKIWIFRKPDAATGIGFCSKSFSIITSRFFQIPTGSPPLHFLRGITVPVAPEPKFLDSPPYRYPCHTRPIQYLRPPKSFPTSNAWDYLLTPCSGTAVLAKVPEMALCIFPSFDFLHSKHAQSQLQMPITTDGGRITLRWGCTVSALREFLLDSRGMIYIKLWC